MDKKGLTKKDITLLPERASVAKPPVMIKTANHTYSVIPDVRGFNNEILNQLIERNGVIMDIPIVVLSEKSNKIFISKQPLRCCIVHGVRNAAGTHVNRQGEDTQIAISQINQRFKSREEKEIEVFISCDGAEDADPDVVSRLAIDTARRWDQSAENIIGFSQATNQIVVYESMDAMFNITDESTAHANELYLQIVKELGQDKLATLRTMPLIYVDDEMLSDTVNPFTDERAQSSLIQDRFLELQIEISDAL
jgi:hypothetical protein